jgi:hypothetical protein
VTHRQALAAFLSGATEGGPGDAALDHIAGCYDCWRAVRDVHVAATGTVPRDDERMAELLGCDELLDDLLEAAVQPADAIARRAPRLARHLAECPSCTEHLNELRLFRADVASGEIPGLASLLAWQDRRDASGAAVRRLVGTIRAGVRRGVAFLVELPAACAALPALQVEPVRGPAPDDVASDQVQQGLRVDLPDAGGTLEVTVHSYDEAHVGLRVRLDASPARACTIRLRARDDLGSGLVAAEPVEAGRAVEIPAVPFGDYTLEIWDGALAEMSEIALSVGPED